MDINSLAVAPSLRREEPPQREADRAWATQTAMADAALEQKGMCISVCSTVNGAEGVD